MADQCIVCLEDLDAVPDALIHDDLRDAGGVAEPFQELATTHPGNPDNQLPIALIKPCNHVLHDECLREWSQKANSCPICRQAFNLVEVLDKVGGKFPLFHCLFLGHVACSVDCFLLGDLAFGVDGGFLHDSVSRLS